MKMGNIFIAGIYGVGKSTFSKKVSKYFDIPNYSASDLIKREVNETYIDGKHVRDKKHNQEVLIKNVNLINLDISRILIDGHLCIFNRNGEPETIPLEIFGNLNIELMILMIDNPSDIHTRMKSRDSFVYTEEQLASLQDEEIEQFNNIRMKKRIKTILYDLSSKSNDESIIRRMGEII
jgi:adenylate kinase